MNFYRLTLLTLMPVFMSYSISVLLMIARRQSTDIIYNRNERLFHAFLSFDLFCCFFPLVVEAKDLRWHMSGNYVFCFLFFSCMCYWQIRKMVVNLFSSEMNFNQGNHCRLIQYIEHFHTEVSARFSKQI